MINCNIYSEIYSVLQMLGTNYINKIPLNLYEKIKEERNFEYNPIYDNQKNLSEQNVDKQTIAFIAMLHLNFWINSQQEKDNLYKIFYDNEQKRLKKYEKDIFETNNNQKIKTENNTENVNLSLIEVKENIIIKIFKKIKSILKNKL